MGGKKSTSISTFTVSYSLVQSWLSSQDCTNTTNTAADKLLSD